MVGDELDIAADRLGIDAGKLEALVSELGVDIEAISRHNPRESAVEVGEITYMILTDEEADDLASENIQNTLWACESGFLTRHMGLPSLASEMVAAAQREMHDGINDVLHNLVKDMDSLVEEAIYSDGRAHFLNTYDGKEMEVQDSEGTTYYLYRI